MMHMGKRFGAFLLMVLLFTLLLGGVQAMAEGDVFKFEKNSITIFEGETMELPLIRQGKYAEEGTLTFKSGRPQNATVDENGVLYALEKGNSTITATLTIGTRTYKATTTIIVARRVSELTVDESKLPVYSAQDPLVSHLTGGVGADVMLLRKGKQQALSISVKPTDANNRRYTVTSSNTDVVRANGATLSARAAGEAYLTVASESNPEVCVIYRVIVITPVSGITVTADAKTLFVGEMTQVSAAITPADADITDVTWTSSNENVALVDEYGVVTAVGRGQATIRATAKDGSGKRNSVNITVKQQPESITLNMTELTLSAGSGKSLKPTVLPNTTSDKTVTYTSSDPKVASVSTNGYVKGIAPGTCVITCQSKNYPAVYAEAVVTVYQPVQNISFNEKSPKVAVGRSIQLSCTVKPSNATNPMVTFSTNKPDVVSVNDDGVVTGLKRGECYVYATANDGSGKKATIRVTITQPVTGLSIEDDEQNVGLNKYVTNVATLEPSNADNKTIHWTSQDERIATVTGDSLRPRVTGRAWGSTTIIGVSDDGGYVVTYRVNVGSKKDALRITNLWAENNNTKIVVYNASNLTIDRFYYTIYLYNAFGDPLICNRDNRSFSFSGTYNYSLEPGQSTKHGMFSFGSAYKKPEGVGQVVMRITAYDIAGGEHFDIPYDQQPEFSWSATVTDGQG